MSSEQPPGWYPDPDRRILHWWDGERYTGDTRPPAGEPSPVPAWARQSSPTPASWQPSLTPAQQPAERAAVAQRPSPQNIQADPPARQAYRQAPGKHYGLRGAEVFWYILGCIDFGAAYFAKLPTKKAACEVFSELQLDGQGPSHSYTLRGIETFWYVLMCLWFGAGYFAKVWAKKALWELVGMVQSSPAEYPEAIRRALSGPTAPPSGF